MRQVIKFAGFFLALLIVGITLYGAQGYRDAITDADMLRQRADDLIAQGRGGESLGATYLSTLLRVEDPNFAHHAGIDFSTPGAGATTITQSLSKRLAFETFRPGIGKIRQTGYAMGLERKLTKEQIIALWLDTLEMGEGPTGWMTGFHRTSATLYGRPPADLSEAEFIRLVAVIDAPGQYDLTGNDDALNERVVRIERLVTGACAPDGLGDVWLEGCR